jgi:uncharacterized protein (TIGR03437 family)
MKALSLYMALLVSAVAFGQPPVGGPPGFTCVANAGNPVIVRTEGITELVGDLLLQCTGGTPTAAGATVPQTNVTVFLNTQVTSRLLPNGFIDALLLIDDPAPNAQKACVKVGSCPIPGTDGVNTYNGQPNIFLATGNGPNSVEWLGVPIDPPGTNGKRVIRITNVRANANQLGLAGSTTPIPIMAGISFSYPFVTVSNPQVTVATAQPGVRVGVPAPGSFQWCPGFNGNQIFSEDTPGVPGIATFKIQVTEGFATSWKTKGSAPQNIPGYPYNTESGFYNPALFPASPTVGQANFGTRIRLTFNNIGAGVNLFVPVVVPLTDAKGAPLGSATGSSSTGTVTGNNLAISPNSAGVGSAVFEVVNVDPTNTNPLSLIVPVTLNGSPQTLQLPWHIQAVAGFQNSQFPQTTLFAPGSPLTNSIPTFDFLTSGVSTPALNTNLWVGSVVGCTNAGNTLNAAPGTPPAFIGSRPDPALLGPANEPLTGAHPDATATSGFTLTAPRVSNVGIVSLALPTTGVTLAKDPTATWLNVNLSGTTTPLTAFLSVNDAAAGIYSTVLKFNGSGGNTLSVPVTYSVTQGPWFTRYGFANSASYVSDVVAPGEPFVIFGGDAFGPTPLAGPALDANGLVVTTLGNTQVLFDGIPAPLYYSVNANGTGQVAGFAPFSLATKTSTNVQVVYNGVSSPPVQLFVLDAVPGLYTAASTGGGQGSILNQDLSINSASNPESPGNLVVLYGGGAGQTTPAGRDGGLAGVGAPLATLTLPVKVFIDGIAATDVPYAGPAPGLVEGVFQINVRIPAGVRHGANVLVLVQVEDKQTQPGVTLATK